jgi:hypothetical protein
VLITCWYDYYVISATKLCRLNKYLILSNGHFLYGLYTIAYIIFLKTIWYFCWMILLPVCVRTYFFNCEILLKYTITWVNNYIPVHNLNCNSFILAKIFKIRNWKHQWFTITHIFMHSVLTFFKVYINLIVYLSRCIIKCDYHIVIIVCTPKILYFCTITGHRVLCISFDWNQYRSKLNIFLFVSVHGQMKWNKIK